MFGWQALKSSTTFFSTGYLLGRIAAAEAAVPADLDRTAGRTVDAELAARGVAAGASRDAAVVGLVVAGPQAAATGAMTRRARSRPGRISQLMVLLLDDGAWIAAVGIVAGADLWPPLASGLPARPRPVARRGRRSRR